MPGEAAIAESRKERKTTLRSLFLSCDLEGRNPGRFLRSIDRVHGGRRTVGDGGWKRPFLSSMTRDRGKVSSGNFKVGGATCFGKAAGQQG